MSDGECINCGETGNWCKCGDNPCSDLPLGKGSLESDAMPTLIESSPVPSMGSRIPVDEWNMMTTAQRFAARQAELCQLQYAETLTCIDPGKGGNCSVTSFQEIPATPIADLQARVHGANLKWWKDLDTGRHLDRNKGEMLALIHSEISECLEGIRKNLMDDKLPHRKMEEVKLADAMIRILDYAGGFKLDLQGAFEDKMAYNATRADHDPENRRGTHGKKF